MGLILANEDFVGFVTLVESVGFQRAAAVELGSGRWRLELLHGFLGGMAAFFFTYTDAFATFFSFLGIGLKVEYEFDYFKIDRVFGLIVVVVGAGNYILT